MENPIDLAIIIVSWNVRGLLANCLRSVQADLTSSSLAGQIWVVDNASTDDSVTMIEQEFPAVQLIASTENLGFAAGNNAALRAMGFGDDEEENQAADPETLPRAVLLLNPDTEVHPGALQAMCDFMWENPPVGLIGAQLQYGDGSFQHGAFEFPGLRQLAVDLLPLPGRLAESRLNGRYPRSRYAKGQPFAIGHPLGAVMCVHREAILEVGLLDEGYQMYVEEIDWSKRVTAAGWQAYCVPTARVTHFSGQSTTQVKIESMINLWRSRYRFYKKYYHPLKLKVAEWIVQAGMGRKSAHDALALQEGQLSNREHHQRAESYAKIMEIWQGKEDE